MVTELQKHNKRILNLMAEAVDHRFRIVKLEEEVERLSKEVERLSKNVDHAMNDDDGAGVKTA